MSELKHHTVHANGIRQHYVDAGDGPPVVLLHGFPFTNYTWRHQIPELAKQYRVIATDLRGYGETDKPMDGYDKRNMASDLLELMRILGIEKISLVGHDRGARGATHFAKDHPEAIDRLVVMDNVPTRIIARDFNFTTMAKTYWLFLFHLKLDLPEILIIGPEEQWLRHLYSEWCYNPHAISGKDFETYVTAYGSPGAVRGCLADYRASAEDLAQDMADAFVKIAAQLSQSGELISTAWETPSTYRMSGREWPITFGPLQCHNVGMSLRRSSPHLQLNCCSSFSPIGLVDCTARNQPKHIGLI
jgi:pimeloyl-ACP methyl ester carboxylesterase